MNEKAIPVGIIGCGAISNAYFSGTKPFAAAKIIACADLDPARAEAKAKEHGIRACSVEQLLRDPEVQLVLNLTIPKSHAEINLAALSAKHGLGPLTLRNHETIARDDLSTLS